MSTLSVELERAKARGDKNSSKWSGNTRSLDTPSLEQGDVIFIPPIESQDIKSTKIGDNTVQYMFVIVLKVAKEKNGAGVGMAKSFFPSTFTKVRTQYEEDGTPTPVREYTKGTAAEEYRKHGSVQNGMEAVGGHFIVVSKIIEVRTLRYGTESLMNAQIPQLDFYEPTEEELAQFRELDEKVAAAYPIEVKEGDAEAKDGDAEENK